VPLGTVKSRIARGIRQLQSIVLERVGKSAPANKEQS